MSKAWIFVVLIVGAIVAGATEPPKLAPEKTAVAPKIDGKFDDACWKTAPAGCPLAVFGSDRQTTDTRAKVAYDDKWLYLALECDNPRMNFLNQLGKKRGDAGVAKDDSVEVFLTREGLGRYFHYTLNFANIQRQQRIDGDGGRDFGWSYPWVSATEKTDKGWTAEIAIPLDVVNGKKPGDVRLNLLRNKIEVELDAMGAKNSEKRVFCFWAPVVKSAHEPERFGTLEGLKDFRAEPPFLPQIAAVKTGDIDLSGDRFRFNVIADVVGRSPVGGKAKMEVVERNAAGEKTLVENVQDLPPRCEKTFKLTVPVADFSSKTLAIRVTDQTTGMTLDERTLDFQGNLIAAAYPELSFYSKEKTFRVKAVMALSNDALKGMSVALLDAAGNVVAETDKPATETILSANVDALKMGKNAFVLALKRKDGKTLGTFNLDAFRFEPGKGSESKVDHFRRAVLVDGGPFFPYGMYSGGMIKGKDAICETIARQIAAAGMNAIIDGHGAFDAASPENIRAIVKEFARHGLRFGFWDNINAVQKGTPEKLKSFSEKAAYLSEAYDKNFKGKVERVAAAIRDEPNMLFWYGVDEPNLGDWESRLFIQKMFYETVRTVDPRHVMFGLYARYVPPVPEAVEYFDTLGYDVYTYANWEGQYADVCASMAAQTAQLDARAAERRQPVWMVPMGTALDPARCPRALSGQEQLCQSYAAIIYGARGLLYFNYNCVYGKETWGALRTLGEQLKAFTPAVLNDAVPQTVSYASGNYDAASWQCPPVPFRFFRFPDGKLMALAVNAKNCPVDATIKIAGLRGARRMFGNETALTVADNAFTDSLEPLAVRAYALDIAEAPDKPLAARLSHVAHTEKAKAVATNDALIKQARARKNLVLNPSMEEQKVTGLPDFCSPYRVLDVVAVGEKGSHWFLDTDNPKFGKVALRMTRYPFTGEIIHWRAGALGTFARPLDADAPHVFSFYARASKDGEKLWVGLPKGAGWNQKDFSLTKEWARYSMPAPMTGLPIHPSFLLQPTSENASVWIDGVQLERGETPTEFSE